MVLLMAMIVQLDLGNKDHVYWSATKEMLNDVEDEERHWWRLGSEDEIADNKEKMGFPICDESHNGSGDGFVGLGEINLWCCRHADQRDVNVFVPYLMKK
ncbi:hypothetical protein ACLOJK_041783 [Asimina triloba]